MSNAFTRICALACAGLVFSGFVAASSAVAAPGPRTTSPQNRERIQATVAALVRTGIPGVIVAVRDGNHRHAVGKGLSDVSRGQRIRPSDRFRVGSVTKTFVATVVLQLIDEGRIGLNDTIEQWLPGLVSNGDEITVRHLLSLRSGIADYEEGLTPEVYKDPFRTWSPWEVIDYAVQQGPLFAPDEYFHYSNTNYVILGQIVEKATGRTIAQQLQRRVFGPLHLEHTSFDRTGIIAGPHAHGYETVDGVDVDASDWNPSWADAAGAITSTAADVMRFQRALLSGALLPEGLLSRMKEMRESFFAGEGYGFGLIRTSTFLLDERYHTSCGPAWGHTGGIPGYKTFAYGTEDGERQFVVLLNAAPPSQDALLALTRVIEAAYCGR